MTDLCSDLQIREINARPLYSKCIRFHCTSQLIWHYKSCLFAGEWRMKNDQSFKKETENCHALFDS